MYLRAFLAHWLYLLKEHYGSWVSNSQLGFYLLFKPAWITGLILLLTHSALCSFSPRRNWCCLIFRPICCQDRGYWLRGWKCLEHGAGFWSLKQHKAQSYINKALDFSSFWGLVLQIFLIRWLCAENSLHIFETWNLVIYFPMLFPVLLLSTVPGMGAATTCHHFSQWLSTSHIPQPQYTGAPGLQLTLNPFLSLYKSTFLFLKFLATKNQRFLQQQSPVWWLSHTTKTHMPTQDCKRVYSRLWCGRYIRNNTFF